MKHRLVMCGALVVMLGNSGIVNTSAANGWADGGPSGPAKKQSDPGYAETGRTSGTFRYYGRAEYRCRRFSFVCGYDRPARYGHYWSRHYRGHAHAPQQAEPSARLGRYIAGASPLQPVAGATQADPDNRQTAGGRETPAPERSGGFTRVRAPGSATRWVRSDTLDDARQD